MRPVETAARPATPLALLPNECDRPSESFLERHGRRVAEELGTDLLGEVPIDTRIVEGGDLGRPILIHAPDSQAADAFRELASSLARKLAVLASAPQPGSE